MNYFFIKKTMKLTKYLTFVLLTVIFISGCTSVKKALTGGKEENTDEFLIKKKSPLILPPNFNDLPEPQQVNNEIQEENKNIDLSSVLSSSKNEKKKVKEKNNSLEKSISNILNNN